MNRLPKDELHHPRRLENAASALWKPQISYSEVLHDVTHSRQGTLGEILDYAMHASFPVLNRSPFIGHPTVLFSDLRSQTLRKCRWNVWANSPKWHVLWLLRWQVVSSAISWWVYIDSSMNYVHWKWRCVLTCTVLGPNTLWILRAESWTVP